MDLTQYSTFVFDCDGVIFDSNRIKTEAFRAAAQPYGTAAADSLAAHHVANGGISRYKKFETFINEIVPKHAPSMVVSKDGPDLKQLLSTYAYTVRSSLMKCAVAEGLEALRASTQQARWLIVSGGDQEELRQIFAKRRIAPLFDGGIFGSPDSKDQILAREIESNTITMPALFLGDSQYDYKVATAAGLDFVFIYGWTEFSDWKSFTASNDILSVEALKSLLVFLS